MNLKIGDIVTRNSYGNDIYFKIIEIRGNVAVLKGINLRLCADSSIEDLRKEVIEDGSLDEDRLILEKNKEYLSLDRSEYFYIPGKVLHLDSDKSYLERCLDFYKKNNVLAFITRPFSIISSTKLKATLLLGSSVFISFGSLSPAKRSLILTSKISPRIINVWESGKDLPSSQELTACRVTGISTANPVWLRPFSFLNLKINLPILFISIISPPLL